jgi:hypothetical protein
VTTSAAHPERDFWSTVPSLLELARAIGEEVERAGISASVRRDLHRLADALPDTPEPLGTVDPYLVHAILTAAVHALLAEEDGDADELRLAVERLRQGLRDVADEHPVWRGGPKDAAMWLRLQNISLGDLAEILAVSEGTVRRWTSDAADGTPSGENAERVVVVAKVVNHLRHAMTSRGVMQWLLRPHPALDDRRPVDELKDPASYARLVHLASGARSVVAS